MLIGLVSQSVSFGQEIELPLAGKLDLSRIIQSTRASFVYDQKYRKLAGAHLPFASLHDGEKREILNLNFGLIYTTENGVGGPFASVSGRVDNILARLAKRQWIRDHVSFVKLPPLELGPFGGYVNRLGWLYGGFVAMGFGGSSGTN